MLYGSPRTTSARHVIIQPPFLRLQPWRLYNQPHTQLGAFGHEWNTNERHRIPAKEPGEEHLNMNGMSSRRAGALNIGMDT